jgi:hypothetical protein
LLDIEVCLPSGRLVCLMVRTRPRNTDWRTFDARLGKKKLWAFSPQLVCPVQVSRPSTHTRGRKITSTSRSLPSNRGAVRSSSGIDHSGVPRYAYASPWCAVCRPSQALFELARRIEALLCTGTAPCFIVSSHCGGCAGAWLTASTLSHVSSALLEQLRPTQYLTSPRNIPHLNSGVCDLIILLFCMYCA